LSRCVTDELNEHLRTVIVAPMTTAGQAYPWRVPCRFRRRSGFVALDQLRTVDAERLVRRLGRLEPHSMIAAAAELQDSPAGLPAAGDPARSAAGECEKATA
jgi:mRNA interferase MazF